MKASQTTVFNLINVALDECHPIFSYVNEELTSMDYDEMTDEEIYNHILVLLSEEILNKE